MKPRLTDHPRLTFVTLIAAFMFLAAGVVLRSSLLNQDGFQWCQTLAASGPDALWSCLTLLGTGAAAYALIAPALLLGRHSRIAASFCALPFATIATHVPKNLIQSDRPAGVLSGDQIHVIGEVLRHSSFPSGHSLTAFTVAAVFILLSKRPALTMLMVLPLAILIAFSRIAVGAHWPADLLAGAGLGWLCGACGVWLAQHWRKWNTAGGVRLMAALIIAVGVSLFVTDFGYPLAQPLQYVLGVIAVTCGVITLVRPQLEKPIGWL